MLVKDKRVYMFCAHLSTVYIIVVTPSELHDTSMVTNSVCTSGRGRGNDRNDVNDILRMKVSKN